MEVYQVESSFVKNIVIVRITNKFLRLNTVGTDFILST